MEEDNKVWLGLGEDLIDLSLFLTNAANNILSYVQSKPWSSKRKQSFLNAYNAIMQSGVTGATSETGLWELTTQTLLDPSSLSNRDLEMLGDAAYFILLQMLGVTSRGTTTGESDKEKTKFVGATAFDNWVSDNYFGGNTFSRPEDWNVLDERDITTGKRGVAKRIAKMKDYLTEYRNSLNDDDWDYSESPIGKNTTEVQAKIDRAISALNGKTEIDLDIIDSLNAIGIRYRDWFDNGLGEDSGEKDTNGNPLTWQEWQKQQAADAKLKAEADAAKLKAQQQAAYNGTLFFSRSGTSKMVGRSAKELKEKYGESGAVIAALNDYSTRRFKDLTPDELSEVHGAMKNLASESISDKMFKNLQKSSSGRYKNASKNRFRVIPGVDGYIWDSTENQVIQVLSRQGYNDSKSEIDLFKGILTVDLIISEFLNKLK